MTEISERARQAEMRVSVHSIHERRAEIIQAAIDEATRETIAAKYELAMKLADVDVKLATAREALTIYGDHGLDCVCRYEKGCDCGFEAALAQIGDQE